MKITRALKILLKDLQLGPRSPIVLYAILMPVMLTILIQMVFGTLLEPKPRLGIVDMGNSQITKEAKEIEGIKVTQVSDVNLLKKDVELNNLDAGLFLKKDFDQMLKEGKRPRLDFFIGGKSLASDRIVLSITTIDLIRKIEGKEPPTDVEVILLGGKYLPISKRLVPLILFYALFIAGVFVPAMSLVEEKENNTLSAVLVTPVKTSEVVFAKAAFGFILASLMTFITLVLNNALGSHPWALMAALFLATIMTLEIGLLFGIIAKDAKALFTLIKGTGFLLFTPAVFYIMPDLPQWIAKIFPTYWMIDPIYKVGVMGAGFADILFELFMALLICILLLPVVAFFAKKMEKKLNF